ncbi:nesprin-4 [Zootoca vivipara]|uniref:nesprin-4 n=1 Tax=Zootoca vivipara TaxID=8524 RepID=UPI00293BC7E8|nr:nesprin-4 [Zootoca vivipara]XP_034975611.2 nesprin-4 [Zootoca vivipara]XP_034975612.2 nesprin-4 [Zootoca vivipara]XP_034975613.2 nesprin-4 [Zootoca vivipara]XP_060131435.1 nesprin-4 [Zootoca vivipara]
MQRIGWRQELPLDFRDSHSCYGCATLCGEQLVPEMAVCDFSTVSVEKRIREEQAWHLRKAFQDLLFRFQDWLWAAELMAASPNSSQVSYANSKKELQRFKVLQRQVSDKLLPLESLNRRYHQLVRTGSNDPQLRPTVQKVNQRWDDLQARTAAICKRLKHFVNQWEKFELEKETIRVWLVELDLRLTDVEHFSGGTSLEKMIQLQAFQQDVQANADRVDHLLVHGEALIQKSQPEDAEVLEEELQDLSCFCQEVFRRVFRFRRRLVSMQLVFEDEWLSDRDSDLESESLTEESLEWVGNDGTGPPRPPAAPMCQSTPKNPSLHRQQPAPTVEANVDLEWDPSVDIGGSTSHDEEDSSYFSAITGMGQWEEPRPKCRPSVCASRSLPLRCGSQGDLSVQNGFREEWEQFSSSVTDQEIKRCSSGTLHSWELQGCQHPQNGPAEKGSPRQVEPMGFDPERIETWLGQSCREKMGGKLEVEQATGTCGHVPLPVLDLQFPVQSQASGKRPKRQKSQQRVKKKTRSTPASNVGQICKKEHLNSRSAEIAVTIEQGSSLQQPSIISCLRTQKLPRLPAIWNRTMMILSASLLLLLLFLASPFPLYPSELSCLQENGYSRSFHFMLTYSGPPPT